MTLAAAINSDSLHELHVEAVPPQKALIIACLINIYRTHNASVWLQVWSLHIMICRICAVVFVICVTSCF